MSDEDAGPRIRELRLKQIELNKARDEALTTLEDSNPKALSREQVLIYVRDLKEVLSEGTFVEQKAFLRSFIKRIEFESGQVAIEYTIPLPTEKDEAIEREVLSTKQIGSAGRTRTYDQAVNSRPLYR